MIDFKNPTYIKLKPVGDKNKDRALEEMLVHGESIFQIFKGVRDKVVFTNKRVIAVNVQGVTGKKVDYTS
ncbi:MAG: PH domain-containing protein, partial [Christensenellaceae bacterium]